MELKYINALLLNKECKDCKYYVNDFFNRIHKHVEYCNISGYPIVKVTQARKHHLPKQRICKYIQI